MKKLDIARENGFNSMETMEKYHKPIIKLANSFSGNILDLGCGNAYLLKIIRGSNERIIPYGIDINKKAIESAKRLQPEFADNFFVGNIFNTPEILSDNTVFDLVILMPGRFLERQSNYAKKEKLINWIKSHSKNILAYAYNDKIDEYGSLENILDLTGLEIIKKKDNTSALVRIKNTQ